MSALLKEQYPHTPSVHVRRIDQAHWAGVALNLRSILGAGNAFKKWEVEAIVDSVLDIMKKSEPLTVDALKTRLHSKSFKNEDASAIAKAIVAAYS